MRIQSLALATTLTLLSSSGLVTTASYAQKGVTLQPSSTWAVKRINQGGTDGYCALARRFKDNVVLTLAKNDKDEASLALDFAQAGFDPSRNYTVTIDPGAGAQRRFTIRPSSSRAFVMRVGNDKPFLAALSKTGYLRVELDNDSFHFNLADIDDGQTQLDACLVEAVMPAAGDESASTAGLSTAGSNSGSQSQALDALRAEQSRLEQRLNALERENETLRVQKAAVEEASATITPAPVVQAAAPTAQADAAMMQGLRDQIQSLKTENDALKNLADTAQKNAEQAKAASLDGSTNGVKDVSLIALARENERLKTLVNDQPDTTNLTAQLEELSQQVSSLESENLDLSSKLDEARQANATKGDLERQLLGLKAENEVLKTAQNGNEDLNIDRAGLQDELHTLESRNQELSSQIKTLSKEKDDAVAQMQAYQKQAELAEGLSAEDNDQGLLEQLRRELQNAEDANVAELAEKERQIVSLQKELEDLARGHAANQDNITDAQSAAKEYQLRVSALEQENASLTSEVKNLQQGNDTLSTLKERVNALETEKSSLETALAEAAAKVSDIEKNIQTAQASSAEIETLNARIASLEDEILTAENLNQSLVEENSALTSGTEGHAQSLAKLEQSLADLKTENVTLKASMEAMASEKTDGQSELAELLAENETLRQQTTALTAEQDKFEKVNQDFEKLRAEHAALLINLEDLKAQSQTAQSEGQSLTQEKDAIISALQDDVKVLEAENAALKTAAAENSTAQESLQSDTQELNAQIETLKTENEAVKGQLASAQETLDTQDPAQDERLAELEAENARLLEKLEERNSAYKQLADDMKDIKTREKLVSAPVDMFAYDEAEALRVKSLILNQEMENMRRQQKKEGANPLLHNASLEASESVVRTTSHSSLRQQDESDIVTTAQAEEQFAEIEPAAGEKDVEPAADQDTDQDVQAVVQKVIDQGSSAPVDAPVPEESVEAGFAAPEESGEVLNEAQMHEQMLKQELGVSTRVDSADNQSTSGSDQDSEGQSEHASFESAGHTPIQEGYVYSPAIEISEILSDAGIAVPDNVALVEKFSGSERVAYQWRTDQNVFGSAHQMPIANMDDFDTKVQDYLSMTEERCSGDFAIIPAMTEQFGQTRIDSYEIACVGAGVDSSASVAFFNVDGTFTILAHEAPTASMESAMATRDKVVFSIAKG